jgi:hypothetical protein
MGSNINYGHLTLLIALPFILTSFGETYNSILSVLLYITVGGVVVYLAFVIGAFGSNKDEGSGIAFLRGLMYLILAILALALIGWIFGGGSGGGSDPVIIRRH